MPDQLVLGIDIGGTTTKLAIVRAADDGYAIVDHAAIDTRPTESAANLVQRMADAARPLLSSAHTSVAGVGIGCPGLIDHRNGVVVLCTNIPHLSQFHLRDELSRAVGLPVEIQNDANAAAVGEFLFGNGRGVANLIVLMLGTGVGGGVIEDGKLLSGADNAAAELGHIKVDFSDNAAPCGCGRTGCLEAYVGMSGIRRIARRHMRSIDDATTTRQITDAARAPSGAEAGGARAALDEVGAYLGRGIATFIETFNPAKIVIGGGASAALDLLLPGIRRSMERYCCFPVTRDRTIIERSLLPDTVPFLGPAAVFLNAHLHITAADPGC